MENFNGSHLGFSHTDPVESVVVCAEFRRSDYRDFVT